MTITKRSKTEQEILEFTAKYPQWKTYGVVSVLAARKLATEGLVTVVEDNADTDGIGHVVVAQVSR